jgi:hypothetical protein
MMAVKWQRGTAPPRPGAHAATEAQLFGKTGFIVSTHRQLQQHFKEAHHAHRDD